MKGTGIIIRKELKRVFSDKKLVFSLFILPAILMFAIYGIMGMLIGEMETDITEHISKVYIVDADETLKAVINETGYAETADITYLTAGSYAGQQAELEEQVLNGTTDLIVVVDSDFNEKLAAYSQAGDAIPEITLSYNSTENYSSQAYSVFGSTVLNTYRQMLLAERLGNLEMLNVFTQVDSVIAKEEKVNSQFISMMLPYLITIMLFSGVMSVGVDAIAGEKERGTLASMLITPVSRREIVVGKLVSMAMLAGMSALIYTASMILAMPLMGAGMGDLAEQGFGGLSLSPLQGVELLLIMLAMVYLFVALIGLLSVFARDTKTASTYISPVYIVVILAAMTTMFNSGAEVPLSRYAIPIYGNALAIRDLCGNELALTNFAVSVGGTVIVAAILTWLITRAFNNEKYMFNA